MPQVGPSRSDYTAFKPHPISRRKAGPSKAGLPSLHRAGKNGVLGLDYNHGPPPPNVVPPGLACGPCRIHARLRRRQPRSPDRSQSDRSLPAAESALRLKRRLLRRAHLQLQQGVHRRRLPKRWNFLHKLLPMLRHIELFGRGLLRSSRLQRPRRLLRELRPMLRRLVLRQRRVRRRHRLLRPGRQLRVLLAMLRRVHLPQRLLPIKSLNFVLNYRESRYIDIIPGFPV